MNYIIFFIIISIITYIFVFSITQSILENNNIIKNSPNIGKEQNLDPNNINTINTHIDNINENINMHNNIIYWRISLHTTIIIMICFILYNKLSNNNILLEHYIILFLIIFISIYASQNYFDFHYIKDTYDKLQNKLKKIQNKVYNL
jgi:hypothetical protein